MSNSPGVDASQSQDEIHKNEHDANSSSQDQTVDAAGNLAEAVASTSQLESFLKHLIERGIVDNEDDESETIHRFLEIYEQFDVDGETFEANGGASPREHGRDNEGRSDTVGSQFETRAIFTLADFFKSLGPNEFYDIS